MYNPLEIYLMVLGCLEGARYHLAGHL